MTGNRVYLHNIMPLGREVPEALLIITQCFCLFSDQPHIYREQGTCMEAAPQLNFSPPYNNNRIGYVLCSHALKFRRLSGMMMNCGDNLFHRERYVIVCFSCLLFTWLFAVREKEKSRLIHDNIIIKEHHHNRMVEFYLTNHGRT